MYIQKTLTFDIRTKVMTPSANETDIKGDVSVDRHGHGTPTMSHHTPRHRYGERHVLHMSNSMRIFFEIAATEQQGSSDRRPDAEVNPPR